MLNVGDVAPEIDLPSSDGTRFRLADRRGKTVILYFFPKAFTPGCTKETCMFRDGGADLRKLGAEVVGISTDAVDKQKAFAESLSVDFPLLADDDGATARAYKVRWPILGMARRATYVIGPEGKIDAVFHHELQVGRHLDDVLGHLRAKA